MVFIFSVYLRYAMYLYHTQDLVGVIFQNIWYENKFTGGKNVNKYVFKKQIQVGIAPK